VQLVAGAARVQLGCLCADPRSPSDGEWVLLYEDDDQRPLALSFSGLVFDFGSAPVEAVEDGLRAAGYQFRRSPVAKPWAASWELTSLTDRAPG